jgi:hypothetical protein
VVATALADTAKKAVAEAVYTARYHRVLVLKLKLSAVQQLRVSGCGAAAAQLESGVENPGHLGAARDSDDEFHPTKWGTGGSKNWERAAVRRARARRRAPRLRRRLGGGGGLGTRAQCWIWADLERIADNIKEPIGVKKLLMVMARQEGDACISTDKLPRVLVQLRALECLGPGAGGKQGAAAGWAQLVLVDCLLLLGEVALPGRPDGTTEDTRAHGPTPTSGRSTQAHKDSVRHRLDSFPPQ